MLEPFTWLPAERYFYPLLNSIGAYQRYTYRLRAVCDAQRQKLLLSGDIEQNPGPIAVLQMNVSCLTPSKLATLMAQGADIIAIQETSKSSEQIASMHTGDYVLYAQSRIGNLVSTTLPRGMHKDGPRLWDDTLMEAERMATDSKARYLQLPTPDREAEMQRTRSQFFLLLRERLRNTYLRRISKLNPGEPLAWKYISGRKKASLPSPTSILLGDGQHTYKTARRAANALNRIFLPFRPSHKAVRFSKGINRQSASLNINASFLFGQQNNNESAATFNSVSSLSPSSEPQDKNEAATTSGLVAHLHSPLDAPFNRTELLAALRNTPYGKAPGPDEVYSEALRHISSKGLRFLLRCINHSWTTGTIPVEWGRATIVL
ncbi:hypothetical protein TCSYLVIO_001397, partial [Trypanosoma cruzi]